MEQEKLNSLSNQIIGLAIDVHKELGPGFIESIYEKALKTLFEENNINFENQKEIKVSFKEKELGRQRVDFIIENEIILELKNTKDILDLHKKQLLSYLKTNGNKLGLLLNFGKEKLEIKRIVNGF